MSRPGDMFLGPYMLSVRLSLQISMQKVMKCSLRVFLTMVLAASIQLRFFRERYVVAVGRKKEREELLSQSLPDEKDAAWPSLAHLDLGQCTRFVGSEFHFHILHVYLVYIIIRIYYILSYLCAHTHTRSPRSLRHRQ